MPCAALMRADAGWHSHKSITNSAPQHLFLLSQLVVEEPEVLLWLPAMSTNGPSVDWPPLSSSLWLTEADHRLSTAVYPLAA